MKNVNIESNTYFSRLVNECNVFRMHGAIVKLALFTGLRPGAGSGGEDRGRRNDEEDLPQAHALTREDGAERG